MQASKKRNPFYPFFAAFLKSRSNLKYFEQKDDPHIFCIFENTDSEKVAW